MVGTDDKDGVLDGANGLGQSAASSTRLFRVPCPLVVAAVHAVRKASKNAALSFPLPEAKF